MNKNAIVKVLFIVILLMLCSFSFAQNIKVIGNIPRADSGKRYQLQIGAYRLAANAVKFSDVLTKNGFTPQYENIRDLVRVFVVVDAADVRSALDRLYRAGFKEVVIREYKGKADPTPPAAPAPATFAPATPTPAATPPAVPAPATSAPAAPTPAATPPAAPTPAAPTPAATPPAETEMTGAAPIDVKLSDAEEPALEHPAGEMWDELDEEFLEVWEEPEEYWEEWEDAETEEIDIIEEIEELEEISEIVEIEVIDEIEEVETVDFEESEQHTFSDDYKDPEHDLAHLYED